VFDVSAKTGMYGRGASYSVFAGRDATRALAKSSTSVADVEDASIGDLSDEERATLDNWFNFYKQRYTIVGVLVRDTGKAN